MFDFSSTSDSASSAGNVANKTGRSRAGAGLTVSERMMRYVLAQGFPDVTGDGRAAVHGWDPEWRPEPGTAAVRPQQTQNKHFATPLFGSSNNKTVAMTDGGGSVDDAELSSGTTKPLMSLQRPLLHVGFTVVGGSKSYDRKDVKDAVAYVRLAVNGADALALERAVNTPPRGVGPAKVAALMHFLEHADIFRYREREHERERARRRAQRRRLRPGQASQTGANRPFIAATSTANMNDDDDDGGGDNSDDDDCSSDSSDSGDGSTIDHPRRPRGGKRGGPDFTDVSFNPALYRGEGALPPGVIPKADRKGAATNTTAARAAASARAADEPNAAAAAATKAEVDAAARARAAAEGNATGEGVIVSKARREIKGPSRRLNLFERLLWVLDQVFAPDVDAVLRQQQEQAHALAQAQLQIQQRTLRQQSQFYNQFQPSFDPFSAADGAAANSGSGDVVSDAWHRLSPDVFVGTGSVAVAYTNSGTGLSPISVQTTAAGISPTGASHVPANGNSVFVRAGALYANFKRKPPQSATPTASTASPVPNTWTPSAAVLAPAPAPASAPASVSTPATEASPAQPGAQPHAVTPASMADLLAAVKASTDAVTAGDNSTPVANTPTDTGVIFATRPGASSNVLDRLMANAARGGARTPISKRNSPAKVAKAANAAASPVPAAATVPRSAPATKTTAPVAAAKAAAADAKTGKGTHAVSAASASGRAPASAKSLFAQWRLPRAGDGGGAETRCAAYSGVSIHRASASPPVPAGVVAPMVKIELVDDGDADASRGDAAPTTGSNRTDHDDLDDDDDYGASKKDNAATSFAVLTASKSTSSTPAAVEDTNGVGVTIGGDVSNGSRPMSYIIATTKRPTSTPPSGSLAGSYHNDITSAGAFVPAFGANANRFLLQSAVDGSTRALQRPTVTPLSVATAAAANGADSGAVANSSVTGTTGAPAKAEPLLPAAPAATASAAARTAFLKARLEALGRLLGLPALSLVQWQALRDFARVVVGARRMVFGLGSALSDALVRHAPSASVAANDGNDTIRGVSTSSTTSAVCSSADTAAPSASAVCGAVCGGCSRPVAPSSGVAAAEAQALRRSWGVKRAARAQRSVAGSGGADGGGDDDSRSDEDGDDDSEHEDGVKGEDGADSLFCSAASLAAGSNGRKRGPNSSGLHCQCGCFCHLCQPQRPQQRIPPLLQPDTDSRADDGYTQAGTMAKTDAAAPTVGASIEAVLTYIVHAAGFAALLAPAAAAARAIRTALAKQEGDSAAAASLAAAVAAANGINYDEDAGDIEDNNSASAATKLKTESTGSKAVAAAKSGKGKNKTAGMPKITDFLAAAPRNSSSLALTGAATTSHAGSGPQSRSTSPAFVTARSESIASSSDGTISKAQGAAPAVAASPAAADAAAADALAAAGAAVPSAATEAWESLRELLLLAKRVDDTTAANTNIADLSSYLELLGYDNQKMSTTDDDDLDSGTSPATAHASARVLPTESDSDSEGETSREGGAHVRVTVKRGIAFASGTLFAASALRNNVHRRPTVPRLQHAPFAPSDSHTDAQHAAPSLDNTPRHRLASVERAWRHAEPVTEFLSDCLLDPALGTDFAPQSDEVKLPPAPGSLPTVKEMPTVKEEETKLQSETLTRTTADLLSTSGLADVSKGAADASRLLRLPSHTINFNTITIPSDTGGDDSTRAHRASATASANASASVRAAAPRYTPPDANNRVTLSTIHAAKGLEWRVVFLAGAQEGSLPHVRTLAAQHTVATVASATPQQQRTQQQHLAESEEVAEERRMGYVAATRARERLFVTYCIRRNFGYHNNNNNNDNSAEALLKDDGGFAGGPRGAAAAAGAGSGSAGGVAGANASGAGSELSQEDMGALFEKRQRERDAITRKYALVQHQEQLSLRQRTAAKRNSCTMSVYYGEDEEQQQQYALRLWANPAAHSHTHHHQQPPQQQRSRGRLLGTLPEFLPYSLSRLSRFFGHIELAPIYVAPSTSTASATLPATLQRQNQATSSSASLNATGTLGQSELVEHVRGDWGVQVRTVSLARPIFELINGEALQREEQQRRDRQEWRGDDDD